VLDRNEGVDAEGQLSSGDRATAASLLWLAGVSLRLTILAVPPLVQLIRADRGLSATEVGLLVVLPTALFAAAATPGAALASRFGTAHTLVAGLALTAIGSALRGVAPGRLLLYAATALMASGVALAQPTLPALVRRWAPDRIGFFTAIYTSGLLVGEVLPVALTARIVLPRLGSWTASLAVWSVPVAVAAILFALFAPPVQDRARDTSVHRAARGPWRSGRTWTLGVLFGSTNALYFATNAFLPGHLTSRGHPELITAGLTALNAGQLPAAVLVMAAADRLQGRARPFLAAALLAVLALSCLLGGGSRWTIPSAAVLGFAVGAAFILALALPPLLCPAEEVARTSAAMFTISYSGAIATALVAGATVDLSGDPRWAFGPIVVCGIAMGLAALLLRARGDIR
jgi:MFS transporter, CP family, cyanate transporter